jgi:hypothetical protein
MNLKSIFYWLGLSLVSMIFTACEEDSPTPEVIKPTLSLIAGSSAEGSAFLPGVEFSVTFRAEKGSELLNAFGINEDGSPLEFEGENARVTFNGENPSANPILLFNEQQNILTIEVSIITPSVAGTYEIEAFVRDAKSNQTNYVFSYSVEEPDLTMLEGVLFNQAGPQGRGGLNLLTGESVGSLDENAHIRDLGININLTPANNWIQLFTPNTELNGTTLRRVTNESTFDEIQYASQLSSVYEAGTEIEELAPGSLGMGMEKIQVGNTYIAKQNDVLILFIVREVNVTSNDNNDNYVLDIKKR